MTDYERIKKAIEYIHANFQQQPDLDAVAKEIFLSPFHFQRLFKEWAGVSPKKFLQYISLQHAKKLLEHHTVLDAAYETGLSGSGRLHDLFINIEGMTPGEYKNGGEQLPINYSFAETPFGNIIVASTSKGICHLAFADDEKAAFKELQSQFPKAQFKQVVDTIQQNALFIFTQDWKNLSKIKLHLKGTVFQIKVWEALLKIPMGDISTYSLIANNIHNPKASRAVGTAIGGNPVAFLIPCHRVIRSTGEFGQYHWGSTRKTAMIGWEAAKTNDSDFDSLKQLALWLKELKKPQDARAALERAMFVYPFDSESHQVLADLARAAQDHRVALREYQALLALDPPDKAAAHLNVANVLLELGRKAEAKKEALAALEIAPGFEPAQELLLKTLESGRPQ